jgi:hypothetical protein
LYRTLNQKKKTKKTGKEMRRQHKRMDWKNIICITKSSKRRRCMEKDCLDKIESDPKTTLVIMENTRKEQI